MKRKAHKVIVLGAGLAGLASAYALSEAEHHVTVLEAHARAGGRVRTLREPFADGLYAELGGQFFHPIAPDLALSYIDEFKLQVIPFTAGGKTSLCHFRGKRFKQTNGVPELDWPLNLTPEERAIGLAGMRQTYLASEINELTVSAISEADNVLKRYGEKSFFDFLREKGASNDAIELLRIVDWDPPGEGSSSTSALELLARRAIFSKFTGPLYAIKGGNDQLAIAFANRLAENIRYGAVATSIKQVPGNVIVQYRQGDAFREIAGDYLVCAIPFSVLKNLTITPSLSTEKQSAIKDLPYSSVTEFYMQTSTKLWRSEGLVSGLASTDLPVTYYWDSTWAQEGLRGILQGYATGSVARELASMKQEERQRFALEQTRQVYPDIDGSFEKCVFHSWDAEPFALGGYSWTRPGTKASFLSQMARPEGRIHFAGEHTAPFLLHATMQGALHSGVRVANEINDAM